VTTTRRSPSQRRAVIFGAGSWIIPIAMSVVLTPVIVRGLGVPAYGVYALVLGFLNNTFTSGLGRGVVRECSGDRLTADRLSRWLSAALTMAGVIGVVAGGLLAFTAFESISSLHLGPELDLSARLAALALAMAFPLAAIQQVLQFVPLAGYRFDVYAQALLLFSVLQTGGTAFLAMRGANPPALVFWFGLAAGLTAGFVLLRMRHLTPGLRIRPGLDRDVFSPLMTFGGAVFVYQLAGYVQVVFERWWIGRTLGLDAVAFYVVSMTLAVQLHGGVAYMARGILPAASAARNAGDAAEFERLYGRMLRTVLPPLVVFIVTLVSLRGEVLSIWMGPAFAAGAGDALGILAVSFGMLAGLIVPWEFFEAAGFPTANAVFGVAWLLAGVAVNVAAVPRWGIVGAAFGRLTLLLLLPVYVVKVERKLFGGVRARLWISVGVLAAAFGAAAAGTSRLIPSLAGGGAAGLAAALAAGGLLAGAAVLSGRVGTMRRT
jgi:O-antigen/teichoic acid export membrane protein